ncbi:hypothetical protein Tco_1170785, partial [Tanacetum coccineum]
RALEGLREIVARDVVKLGVLEQLVACTRVGIPLKVGYVADMDDTEYMLLLKDACSRLLGMLICEAAMLFCIERYNF